MIEIKQKPEIKFDYFKGEGALIVTFIKQRYVYYDENDKNDKNDKKICYVKVKELYDCTYNDFDETSIIFISKTNDSQMFNVVYEYDNDYLININDLNNWKPIHIGNVYCDMKALSEYTDIMKCISIYLYRDIYNFDTHLNTLIYEETCINAIKRNTYIYKYIMNKTFKICVECVKLDGMLLKYVNKELLNFADEDMSQIYMEAVKNNGNALQYVMNQNEEICMEAINKNIYAFRYIKNKTFNILMKIIDIDSKLLIDSRNIFNIYKKDFNEDEIKLLNDKIENAMIRKLPEQLELIVEIKNKTFDMVKEAIRKNGMILTLFKIDDLIKEFELTNDEIFNLYDIATCQCSDVIRYIPDDINKSKITHEQYIKLWINLRLRDRWCERFLRKLPQKTYQEIITTMIKLAKELSYDEIFKLLERNGNLLEHVEDQTDEMCMVAVSSINNDNALSFVKNQTYEICLKAVRKNGDALEYVINKTEDICLEAVKKCGNALRYIDDDKKTYEICLEAVRKNGDALKYVNNDNKTLEICLMAIKYDVKNLRYVNNLRYDGDNNKLIEQLIEIYLEASNKDSEILAYIDFQKLLTHTNNEYVREQIETLCLKEVRKNGLQLMHVKEQQTEDVQQYYQGNTDARKTSSMFFVCIEAVKNNGNALIFVNEQTYEICKYAVQSKPSMIKYVNNQTIDICVEAVYEKSIVNLFHVRDINNIMYIIDNYPDLLKKHKNSYYMNVSVPMTIHEL
jgi:hypothetical protein